MSNMPLYTIGYEKREVGQIVAALQKRGVTRLVDVRAVPISRKAGFSKHVLARELHANGIKYTHLKALGTPKAGREAAHAGDGEGMRRIYAKHLALPESQVALDEAAVLAQAEPICLLCFERDPALCHRTIVAEEISEKTSLTITHLLAE